MKRFKSFISIGLLLAFLSGTIGLQLNKHYCGGFLASISLYLPAASCSDLSKGPSCEKESKKMSCCDDETEFHQLDLELFHPTIQVEEFSTISSLEFTPQQNCFTSFFERSHAVVSILERPPPNIKSLPFYKKHHQFIFYG